MESPRGIYVGVSNDFVSRMRRHWRGVGARYLRGLNVPSRAFVYMECALSPAEGETAESLLKRERRQASAVESKIKGKVFSKSADGKVRMRRCKPMSRKKKEDYVAAHAADAYVPPDVETLLSTRALGSERKRKKTGRGTEVR